MGHWPDNVGIIAMEMIFPSQYVDQTELEIYDGVAAGKYTIGLGQGKMGFCSDREDIHSLCLTVLKKLMEKNNIKCSEIGRLEVGTETILDKSKSVKSVLMQLFEEEGVTDVEGIDTTNACYGGTSALFNAISWVESSAWNGRYAVVIAGDIAVYAKGSARPTGGAGAVAMLIGPDAPLVFDRGVRSTYMRHAYDFYKPDLSSEYPVVDGKLSIQCYINALDQCYQLYIKKAKKVDLEINGVENLDAVVFHTPFCKLVQKSLARMVLNDYLSTPDDKKEEKYPGLDKFKEVKLEKSYTDRDVEKAFMTTSQAMFNEKTKPSLLLANQVGNMYTSSVYGGLVSYLVSQNANELAGKRVGIFSYGSGLASSMFSLTIDKKPEKLEKLLKSLSDVVPLLEKRKKLSPEEFNSIMEIREKNCHAAPYVPVGSVDTLFPGTFYLEKVDEAHRRTYLRNCSENHV